MRKFYIYFFTIFLISTLFYSCSTGTLERETTKPKPPVSINKESKVDTVKKEIVSFIDSLRDSRVESIKIDSVKKTIVIICNKGLSYIPFRQDNVKDIYSEVKSDFGEDYKDYSFTIKTLSYPIEDLIPNYFRADTTEYDTARMPSNHYRPSPVAQDISKTFIPSSGLFNRNIVVWPSHGWYYANKEDRWEWQRPRLFQSVEDLLPLSFTVPYLLPMLENAGAVVFDPRERDIQKYSVVVDNDSRKDVKKRCYLETKKDRKHRWSKGISAGFASGNPPYPSDYNPFEKGTYRTVHSDTKVSASVSWIPNIPEDGHYAVYISYHASDRNVSDARYTIYHSGVKTEFKVNQQIGGSTWIYLGEFKFEKGYHPKEDKVVLTNKSGEPGKIISCDAVRFGGGMGIIERGGEASGRPKIFEGARYYLQYAGMPDSLVYDLNKNKNDYNDDYQSRPEYVNYLYGKPFGPNLDRDIKGLGIPVDLSLAFHTDAGIIHNDTTIGTLSIYSISDAKHKPYFPDGMSRLANRDLADLVQTQIVSDIRAKYDPAWTRRHLENGNYSESRSPNVPSLLIELLSHQNFLDMKFAHDPQFRFDVARAMYKGMLRFIATENHYKYVVEPLPVNHFMSSMDSAGDVTLKWQPTEDPLEVTAKPDRYIVYTRANDGSFDNGVLVYNQSYEIKRIKPGVIYSYKVTAVNNGGESFPSEILSVCRMDSRKKPVLIVNGFYRVAGPAYVQSAKFTGFLNEKDPGIADRYDLSYTGSEYDFDSTHQWISNDNPGWGASHADYEAHVIAGNTFDYPYIHGQSIMKCGYPFVSVSAQTVEDNSVELTNYKFVDLILGEQKSTHWERAKEDSLKGVRFKAFPEKLQQAIRRYCNSGGNLFISGCYVASDIFNQGTADSTDINFAEKILHYTFGTGHAARTGEVFSADQLFMKKFSGFSFNTKFNDKIYAVTAPDEVEPVNGSKTILRYTENQFSAGTAYKGKYGAIVFGFPFETIANQDVRNDVMNKILSYFGLQ